MNRISDLHVEAISNALAGKQIDLIVSGSIAACESPRTVRSLRRLGAEVRVLLTTGGSQFITKTSLEWASARSVIQDFEGQASHIATSDALVIAPGTASILEKVCSGDTKTPESALIQSYIGQDRPVLFLPCMHQSLNDSIFVQENISRLKSKVTFLEPKQEEGKLKIPEPAELADQIAHFINRNRWKSSSLICMGPTRGYFDKIRYISNYSSGRLGSLIAEEFYRQGSKTHIVAGPCKVEPRLAFQKYPVKTHEEMTNAIGVCSQFDIKHIVMLASVLDYVPKTIFDGKLRSGDQNIKVELKPTPKILEEFKRFDATTSVGFKLEPQYDDSTIQNKATEYIEKYALSQLIVNPYDKIQNGLYQAVPFLKNSKSSTPKVIQGPAFDSRKGLADYIVQQAINHEPRN